MKMTDDGIEMTLAEAEAAMKGLTVGAFVSLGLILIGLVLYFTPMRHAGGLMMLGALIPTFLTVVPLALLRLAQARRP